MKTLLISAALAAVAIVGAQTIATRPTLSSDGYRVLVLTPNGPVGAKLGAGLTITAAPGEIIISAQQQTATALAHRFLMLDTATRNLSGSGCAVVFRNGIAMLEGAKADYTRTTAGGVRINDTLTLDAADQWSGLCN